MSINYERPKIMTRKLITAVGIGAVMLSGGVQESIKENREQMRDRAKIELSTKGITSEQKGTYILGINDLLYYAISPRSYTMDSYKYAGRAVYTEDGVRQRPIKITISVLNRIIDGLKKDRFIETDQREDAWRMYLGKPQIKNTFGISDHFPTNSTQETYYYKFNDPLFLLKPFNNDYASSIKRICNSLSASSENKLISQDSVVLNNFKWSKGADEKGYYVAYYDEWDLNVPIEKKGLFGKPLEIYGRIYYDPETFEILSF